MTHHLHAIYMRKADLVANPDNAARSHVTLHMKTIMIQKINTVVLRKTISQLSLFYVTSRFRRSGLF
jgi:hypothetical protein